MTIPLQTITVDGWSCYDGNASNTPADADGNLWIWQAIEGWHGDLTVRENPIDRPMMDGDYDGPTTFAGRTVLISGTLVAPDRTALQRGLDTLARVLAGQTRRAQMVVDEAVHGVKRAVTVRLNAPTLIQRITSVAAEWSLSVYTPDPLRYSPDWNHLAIVPYREGTGRVYNLVFPRSYGAAGTDGTGVAFNAGSAPTAPIVTFLGPSTKPELRIVGGDKLALNAGLPLLAGERVEIDCGARTVNYFSGGSSANRRQNLTADSRWLSFPPGSTSLLYTVGSGTGLCEVAWRDAWS